MHLESLKALTADSIGRIAMKPEMVSGTLSQCSSIESNYGRMKYCMEAHQVDRFKLMICRRIREDIDSKKLQDRTLERIVGAALFSAYASIAMSNGEISRHHKLNPWTVRKWRYVYDEVLDYLYSLEKGMAHGIAR